MVDISKEAVERLARVLDGKDGLAFTGINGNIASATLRAQAARIEELEDELYSIAIMDAGASL